MKQRPRVLCVATVLLVSVVAPTKAGVFEGFPDMILCDFQSGKIVVYIDRVLDDGGAIYKVLSGQGVTVDSDGVLHRENLPDCDGKSLTQLREEGKTLDFSPR